MILYHISLTVGKVETNNFSIPHVTSSKGYFFVQPYSICEHSAIATRHQNILFLKVYA